MNQSQFQKRYGPWAVVTGASEGIGYAFAHQTAALGMNLALAARRGDRLQQLAQDLKAKYRVHTVVVEADLSTPKGLDTVVQATAELDVGLFIACAGFGTSGPLLQADLARERNMLEVNCFAVLHGCVVFGNRFRQRGGGGMILMASLVGWQGTPHSAHYAATKAYVQSLAEALAVEFKNARIDVLASAPGPVHSGFAARADMRMTAAVSPVAVARVSLRALGRKGTVIPGGLSKLLTWSLRPLPRRMRTRILAQVMGGMTKHQGWGTV